MGRWRDVTVSSLGAAGAGAALALARRTRRPSIASVAPAPPPPPRAPAPAGAGPIADPGAAIDAARDRLRAEAERRAAAAPP